MRLVPPVYFVLHALGMVALDRSWPIARWIEWPWRLGGALLLAGGVALVVASVRALSRHGTTIRPFETSTALVVTGLYRWSRNPIYVGLAIALAGVAVLLGSLSPWVLLPVFVAVLRTGFVRVEERVLEATFGDSYRAYCASVRRWI